MAGETRWHLVLAVLWRCHFWSWFLGHSPREMPVGSRPAMVLHGQTPKGGSVNIPTFDYWRMGDRAGYLLFRSSGDQLWLERRTASHGIKVPWPTGPAEDTLRFTFLLTNHTPPSLHSCASGLFLSNYFHCHTGSTFFYCEGQSRLRQLTCHILEQLVKRPNFPKGEFQLYQLTHKPYIETYG